MKLSKFAQTDKVAVVTGSGRGIGKGLALAFARAGADLVIAELDAPDARVVAEEIHALGQLYAGLPMRQTMSLGRLLWSPVALWAEDSGPPRVTGRNCRQGKCVQKGCSTLNINQ